MLASNIWPATICCLLSCFWFAAGQEITTPSPFINYDSQLKTIVVIYRHGDRTPVDPYPLDPYRNASLWPVGFGQLTNLGKWQHYELGRYLRKRYDDFLPRKYSPEDIFVRSTDVDRTLMSAQANLAGLYPPVASDAWDPGLLWQPIPVHTEPEIADVVLAMKTNCPRYNYFHTQLLAQPYFTNIAAKNQALYEYVTKHTGRQINDIQSLEFLYNTLFIEELYNFTLPAWTHPVYPAAMRELAGLSFAIPSYNADLARLKTGPLWNEIWQQLRVSANGTEAGSDSPAPRVNGQPFIENRSKSGPKKMWVYSAHDTTIASVLNSLGAFDLHSPPYTSTVIIELRQSRQRGLFINVYYKNTSTTALPIILQGCKGAFDCPLDQFEAIIAPLRLTTSEWYAECEQLSLLSLLSFESVEGVVFFVLCVFVLMIVLMLIVCIFCAKPKCEQRTYLRLPDNDEAV